MNIVQSARVVRNWQTTTTCADQSEDCSYVQHNRPVRVVSPCPLTQSGTSHRCASSVPARPPVVVVAPRLPASDVKDHVLGVNRNDPRMGVGIGKDVDRFDGGHGRPSRDVGLLS